MKETTKFQRKPQNKKETLGIQLALKIICTVTRLVDQVKASLVLRPPNFFVLQFVHGIRRVAKLNKEGLETPIT